MHLGAEDVKNPVLATKPVDPDFKAEIGKMRAYEYDEY